MFVNKIFVHTNIFKNKTNNSINTSKPLSFAGHSDVPKKPEDILNYLNSLQINLKDCVQKNDDNNKVSLLNYDDSFNKKKLEKFASEVTDSIKTNEQQKLLKKILENENLVKECNLNNLQRIIQMSSNSAKYEFVSKILDNEDLYANQRLLAQLPFVLNEENFDDTVVYKISVLDKIVNNEKLAKNSLFMKNLPEIFINIDSKLSMDIINRVFDCILNNEKCSNNEKFISALGKVFAIPEFHRRYGDALQEVKLEFGQDSRFANIISAIAQILDEHTIEAFEILMKDKSFIEDENLVVYLPSIVSWVLSRNISKLDSVINYLRKNVSKHTKENNKRIVKQYMHYDFNSIEDVETLVRINEKALKQKHLLKSPIENLKDSEINDFFDYNRYNILSAINLLGEKVFVHSFSSKLSGVKDLCDKCCTIEKNINPEVYERLLLKLNPVKSKEYKALQNDILLLKKEYLFTQKNKSVEELKVLQNKINTKTKQAQNLLDNKLHLDPDSVISKVRVLSGVIQKENLERKINGHSIEDNKNFQNSVNNFVILLKDSTPQNNLVWNQAVYKKIFDNIGMEFNEDIAHKINLVDSKYIGEILSANTMFFKGLKDIFELVKLYPHKSITEIFNDLDQNKITKQLFEKFGINYDKWVNFDKESFINVNLKVDKEEVKSKAISNLKSIFNDPWYYKLPQEYKDNLLYELEKEGILVKNVYIDSLPSKYAIPNLYSLKIDNNEALRKTITLIENELNKDIWISAHPDIDIDARKEYIYNLFLDRISKIRELLDAKSEAIGTIKIQKVDMNDLAKSLFLGNDAACCTSVGRGREQATAPKYVKNKTFSAIEILDDKKIVGNTMCYFALVNGQLALVLDNIEIKLKYKGNDAIRDGVIDYAKKLCKEVGVPDLPIYVAGLRNKIDFKDEFSTDLFGRLQIVGNTGDDYAYLDFLNTSDRIDFNSKVYTSVCLVRVA